MRTCHFCISQLGAQEWLMKRASDPAAVASITSSPLHSAFQHELYLRSHVC
jgi:hypothetical protein